MKAPIKLIVTDIDGTLLNSHHELTSRTHAALMTAQAAGVKVVLATGRPRKAKAIELLEALQLDTPGIFLQGGMIHAADGSVLYRDPFDHSVAAELIKLADREDFTAILYCGLEILFKENNSHTAMLWGYREADYQAVGDLSRFAVADFINKVIVVSEPENIPSIRATLHEHLNGSAKLVQTLPMAIEVLPQTVSKGHALEWIAKMMDIELENIIAFGDAENDVEMLEVAGIGVAMGNAMPATLAVADIIAPSNDEDGVAQIVEEYILKNLR